MASPEIRRGDFIYRDTLFVDLGDNKRHPRASVPELKDLLMPKGAQPKDQVAHWYEAQLVHYGLQRVKDKNAAKVRLTTALAAKTLKVPEYVAKMEEGMKKEYASALRKAKGATETKEDKETPAKGKKRKADDGAGGVGSKVVFTMDKDGAIRIEADQHDAGAAPSSKSKRAKTEPKATKKTSSTPKPKASPKTTSTSAAKAAPTTARSATASASPSRPAATAKPTRPRQTARKSRPFEHPGLSTRPAQQSPQRTYDHTPTSFNSHHLTDSDDDDPPPPYSSHPYSHARSPSPSPDRSDRVQISGLYNLQVTTPSGRPLAPRNRSLALDHGTDSLWGTFHIGPKRGLIRMNDTTRLPDGDTRYFGWRSEDENSGSKMRFGRGCDGEMAFSEMGRVVGKFTGGLMYGEDVEFWGELVDEDDRPLVDDVRKEWDSFPDRAYGRG